MEQFDANVGAIDAPLQQRPEVLKSVGVDAPVDVLDGVIHNLMGVVASETLVGEQEVGIESRSRLNMLADLRLKSVLLPVGNDDGANLSATLKDAHDSNLVFSSVSCNSALTDAQVHVASLAADEGLIRLDLATIAANLHQGTALHGETDAMKHEPSSFLSDAEGTGKLTRANCVLSRNDNPDRRKPLLKAECRVLEDGSHLRSELTLAVCALALPLLLLCKPSHIVPSASGVGNSVRPAMLHHVADAVVGVCEVNDCFLESGRAFMSLE